MPKGRLLWRARKKSESSRNNYLDCGCAYDCYTGIYGRSCDYHYNHPAESPFSVCPKCNTTVVLEYHKCKKEG
jgi:hypothetical protein